MAQIIVVDNGDETVSERTLVYGGGSFPGKVDASLMAFAFALPPTKVFPLRPVTRPSDFNGYVEQRSAREARLNKKFKLKGVRP